MPARSPFTQASAAMPTQNVTDLDALQADIERKRRMAELLQSQQFKGMQLASPNAPASILNRESIMFPVMTNRRLSPLTARPKDSLPAPDA